MEQLDISMSRRRLNVRLCRLPWTAAYPECEIVAAGKTSADGRETYVFTLSRLIGGVPGLPVSDFGNEGVWR